MFKDIEALHTGCFSSTDLTKNKHGQGTDWHHQLGLLTGAADGGFGSRGLQFPPAAVPRAKVIEDFEGKGAFFMVTTPGDSLLDIDDASQ